MNTSRTQTGPTKTVLLGCHGVGKSTIHNTLLGKFSSESGVSMGSGLTTVSKEDNRGNFICVDTPGLSEIENADNILREISKALRGPCKVRLVFMVTLAGAIPRAYDLSMLAVVLDAFKEVVGNMDNKFMLIINKCEDWVHEGLSDKNIKVKTWSRSFVPFNAVGKVGIFRVIRYYPPADKKEGLLPKVDAKQLRNLIEKLPAVYVPDGSTVRLDRALRSHNKDEIWSNMEHLEKALKRLDQREQSRGIVPVPRRQKCASLDEIAGGPVDGPERAWQRFKRTTTAFVDALASLDPWVTAAQVVCGFIAFL